MDYFKQRGLTDGTIKTFSLGYCDTSGYVTIPEVSSFIDRRFHHSALFPICNLYNVPVSVSARPLSTGSPFKYVHTNYDKAHHMYGLNITWPDILKARKAFIVEGNFDLLTLHQHGITNAVAMLGSQFSPTQLCLLTRFCDEIVIATDGDEPGRKCAAKITKLCQSRGIKSSILKLPSGTDPDNFVKTYGPEAFLKLVPRTLSQLLG
jgi:DNA primase